jgi:uncharacterized protein (TIGR00255 family)
METKKPKKPFSSISSMTGYGTASGESPEGRITVEVRSLNHRYLEIFVRAPRAIVCLEPEIRKLVKCRVSRGKVELFISVENPSNEVSLNLDRALKIAGALREVADSLGDKVRLEHVLSAGDITAGMEQQVTSDTMSMVSETVRRALDNMVEHRIQEGESLAKDVAARMKELDSTVELVETLAPEVPIRVRKQVNQFIAGVNLGDLADPQRLEVEIALMSQRSDIAEEITRLKTHVSAFKKALSGGGVVGRRMDFLLQEMQREINTIGSKSGLTEISRMVVDFKAGLEKIREQVQNIE